MTLIADKKRKRRNELEAKQRAQFKLVAKHRHESNAVYRLYRVRQYLLNNYYEEYGGWVSEAHSAAHRLLGKHLRTSGIRVYYDEQISDKKRRSGNAESEEA